MKRFFRSNHLLILVILFSGFGCENNELIVKSTQDVQNAKIWFETNKSRLINGHSSGASGRNASSFHNELNWEKTKVHQFKNGMKAVEVVLNDESRLIFSEGDGLNLARNNIISSILLVEIRPGEYGVYLSRIYPEANDTRFKSKDFNSINFGSVPNNFSGSVLVFDWNENFIGGWKVNHGKRTHFYGANKSSGNPDGRTKESSSLNCYAVDTHWYSQTCTRGGVCSDPVLIEITTTVVCEIEVAPPSEDPSEGGGVSGGGSECFEQHPYIEGLMIPCEQFETITNNVTDPCISQQVNNSIAADMTNEISNLIRSIYNVNDIINLTIDQVNYLGADVAAITDGYRTPSGSLNIDISFNGNTMPSASQEYIMATLYHEFLHAIMNFNEIQVGQQHEPMATRYINIMANALVDHFPNLSLADAVSLAWGGLQETEAWSRVSDSEKADIIATNISYRNNESGTACN